MKLAVIIIFQLVGLAVAGQTAVIPYVLKNGKWCFVKKYTLEKAGKETYDNIEYIQEGVYIVNKGLKYGLVDTSGKMLVPIEYEKHGFTDKFHEGMLPLKKNDMVYFFTKKGELAYRHKFEITDMDLLYNYGLLVTEQGTFDKKGNIVIKKYDWQDLVGFRNGLLVVAKKVDSPAKGNMLFGLIDTLGRVVLDLKYNMIYQNEDSSLEAWISGDEYECYTHSGKKFLSGEFPELQLFYRLGYYNFQVDEEKQIFSLRSLADHRQISDSFIWVMPFPGNRMLAFTKDSAQYVINDKGEITTRIPDGSHADVLNKDIYFIKTRDTFCLYDRYDNKQFCTTLSAYNRRIYPEGILLRNGKKGKFGFANWKGEMLVEPIYTYVIWYPELKMWMIHADDGPFFLDDKGNKYYDSN